MSERAPYPSDLPDEQRSLIEPVIKAWKDRLREADTHLEHLAITRNTVAALADRLPTQTASPDLPEHE